MENLTKFRIKPENEIKNTVAGLNNIFVIACNKCFKEFSNTDEPECENLVSIISDCGKNITGSTCVDFLCNKVQTVRKLKDIIPDSTENVIVASCGLGVQTIADILDAPVFAAADSINYTGHHGMALTDKACDACAQCYLNITGGICPIVDCSKSLLNGQCGGAKNGKCEVSPDKDCAWEKIYRRLEQQGRLEEFLSRPTLLRDYNKVNYKLISEYVADIRAKRFDGYYGGVHPVEGKEYSEHLAIKKFPEPDTVVIPLSMHSGKPADPIVSVGDYVKVGQKIGEMTGFISAPVHSSCSGTVVAIEERKHPVKGSGVLSVVIKNDGKNIFADDITPNKGLDELSAAEIIEIIKNSGIVGMGGAGFPAYVKLQPGKPIDAVLLNGCECEPLLTADHRILLENAEDVVFGLKAILKAVNAPKGIIVIEDNKPDAIEAVNNAIAGCDNIEVCVARTKYPQGAEKMIVKRVLGRTVPSGGLPADAGAVVSNVSTAKAISNAIRYGRPLVDRVVSVTGEFISKPGNYLVKFGTSVKEIIEYCGGITNPKATIKIGGLMMGTPVEDTDIPIIKASNGIIAVNTDISEEKECIKCGRCVDVCPMELSPLYFHKYYEEKNWKAMSEKNIKDCMECRSCEFICSSKIRLVSKIKAGKAAVAEMK